jgi:hypothetical protein
MTGVRLAEIFGVLGEQADKEIDPAEVTVGQSGQPGPDLTSGSISTSYRPDMHLMLYVFAAI